MYFSLAGSPFPRRGCFVGLNQIPAGITFIRMDIFRSTYTRVNLIRPAGKEVTGRFSLGNPPAARHPANVKGKNRAN